MRGCKRRAEAVAEGLLTALEQAVGELTAVPVTRKEKTKTPEGDVSTEYTLLLPEQTGPVNLGGLRQITGVLKDMREIYGLQPDAELREQQYRLEKLSRELQDTGNALCVTWQEDTEDYAQ